MVTSAVSFAAARRRVYVCRPGAATGCASPDLAIPYDGAASECQLERTMA